jgi:hypothetical protein
MEITRNSVGPPYEVLLKKINLSSIYFWTDGHKLQNLSWFSKYLFSKNCDKLFIYAAQEMSVFLDVPNFQF